MQPTIDFLNETATFWAFVKFCSERLKYSERRASRSDPPRLKRYDAQKIQRLAQDVGVEDDVVSRTHRYLNARADMIEDQVVPNLMDRSEAKQVFEALRTKYPNTSCKLPDNTQSGKKAHKRFLTCIINILTEAHLQDATFDDDPGRLTTITDEKGCLVSTLSRRMDGAYPGLRNPIALWEIKEYYGTTSFGSRVGGPQNTALSLRR